MNYGIKCLVFVNIRNTKNALKGQPKLSATAYNKDNCRCDNCKMFNMLRKKRHRDMNPEKIKQYHREYRKNNKQKIKEYRLKRLITHPIDKEEYRRKYSEYQRNYINTNREKVRGYWRNKDRKRRSSIKNNGYEKYTEKQVLDLYGSICYLCNTPIDMSASRLVGKPGWQNSLHIEHVIDIAKGGPDTLANVRPSHAICNLTKKPREMV